MNQHEGRASKTIPALLAATVARAGGQDAVVDGERRLTWSELDDASHRFGAALVASGVPAGARVAIWTPNCAEWIVAVLGLWRAGATLVPINTRFKGREAAELLARSGATALLTVTDFLDTDYWSMLQDAGVELPDLTTVIIAKGGAADGTVGWADFLGRATDAAATEVDDRSAALTADSVSDILFTSGTTGVPKGVVMTHGRTRQVATDWVAMAGLQQGDRYLMVNPYFHMFGLKAGILASTTAGATMYPEPVFDAGRAMARVAAEQITIFPGAPTLYQSILDHPERGTRDLSSLRVAVTGAADIPVELIRRIDTELPFSTIITGYGLTEAGTVSATSADDDATTTATTVGRARPGYEIRIVDSDLVDVPVGEPGEVLVRSATVMAGYLDDPAATAEALDADGWLRTGDLGIVGDDGCLRIVGRSKDMFIVGGFNAYPAEIENVLLGHPEVQQVAVIGVPDERLGEVGMAFVVSSSSASDDELAAGVLAWAKDQMANYKVPRSVLRIDELPINATGKVVKDELRTRAAKEGR